ncbi:unnamed protein product [Arabidopsis lyrata]|uniref:KIB1-4 beta-propeller domain-containing protein n=2 Tax=Arabidopsis TaxID=3701 RepID=D7MU89_ARALL|nr:uncharacterized protein LOC9300407 [Arabidopsis lyrata subsp. lyrata]EFH40590.1 hypothetical protein ARALYDRAFT_495522 [Arabidopsis lyrata subsp. lyrata]KAG7534209.1 hypothetical protein ISN45_Aa08g017900 [Arabidopsis thaliana x Arabidopsis arenosa]CAH8279646.1 unnamed protein product [Arabidopsis lyrata]|eukprot:XP_002864331.1 uncharacterized protein LOC9300407 [Arabidopsis lyrata subsp. lyrata]
MALLLNQPLKLLCFRRKPVLVRSSPLLSNDGLSSSLLQTPPCFIVSAKRCGRLAKEGKLVILNPYEDDCTSLDKKVPMALLYDNELVTIGSSHGWIATLSQDDGLLRLQDDLNPVASDTNPKRIPLPPLVTLPHCQTQIVTNVSLSASSPEDEDCVVAVKFLGPQLSFCRPAQSNSEWINIRIENPCFYSSRVMYSKKDNMFCIPGSGGHLIGTWDLRTHKHNLQSLQFQNLPKLTKTKQKLLDSCCKSEHLVESPAGETFLVKWYKKSSGKIIKGIAQMKTQALMVFKLDEQGNAVYTQDIGDLCIFLSKSEPFCVPASSFPGLCPNTVTLFDCDEGGFVHLDDSTIITDVMPTSFKSNYLMPPQKLD